MDSAIALTALDALKMTIGLLLTVGVGLWIVMAADEMGEKR